jgi:fused signal recognition particle receptor
LAFFKKLKERLFNSSSKIDEGLEAIVGDGGQEEALAVEDLTPDAPAEVVEDVVDHAAEQAEAARVAAELAAVQEAERAALAHAEQERAAALAHAEQERVAEVARAAALKEQQDAADKLRRDAADQAERDAAEAAQKRAAALAEQQAATRAAAALAAQELAAQELAAQELEEREAAAKAERVAAEQAEETATEAKAATPEPLKTVLTPVAPILDKAASEPAAKPGLLGRLMGRAAPKTVVRRVLDDDMLEQLEELLIAADMGVDTALRVTANMAEGRFGKKLSVDEIKLLMSGEIARIMEPVAKPLPLYAKTPQVVLVVGVNGSGKTTTIGKLASQFKAAGKQVVIAAGDTFRAAAVEQLQVWGDRAGVPVLTAEQGSDPASLAFDAMTQAEADGADLLLIDTAGRLQNRGDLMEELAKIVRVIRKKDPSAPHNTLLVLDATTGQNAVNQVKVFQEISDVSGLVMTKLDGTAKGGVLVALADKFGLPIHAIGVGEQIDDLDAFDPAEFADALVGVDR